MPKTLDERVQDVFGGQTLLILRLQAENEALAAENVALKARVATTPVDPSVMESSRAITDRLNDEFNPLGVQIVQSKVT